MGKNALAMTVCTGQTVNPAAPGLIFIQIYRFEGNPLKYTDPDGRMPIPFIPPLPIPFIKPIPIPFPNILPFPGTVIPPIIIDPSLDNNYIDPFTDHDIDMGNTDTWPRPPSPGPFQEGPPSRVKPRERGEKSLFDQEGGEWRPHLPDKFHPKGHWDYKPPADHNGEKFPKWQDVYPSEPALPFKPDFPMV
jgi:hypothetical protein